MRRQYKAPRFRASKENHPGPVEAGDYLRIGRDLFRVEGWLPRDYYPCVPGKPSRVRMAGGHLASVTRIRDHAGYILAEQRLYQAYDELEDLPGMDPVRDHRPVRYFAQHMNDYWSAP